MSHTYVIDVSSLRKEKPQPDRVPMFSRTEESFTKFRAGNIEFYYSNFDNGIYDVNKNPLSEVAVEDELYKEVISETRSRLKSDKPFWIRILLGHACNYSCSYCMQKDIGNPDERAKISTTDQFIQQLSKLDMSRLQKIDLWGGETLLYWKTIVEIMTKFDREELTWYIPTNGSPLMMKHVEFFSTLKSQVTIGISHDGPGQEELRGAEFLHKKMEVLRALQQTPNVQFSFNPVVSHNNFDLFKINKFFYDYCIEAGLDYTKIGISWTLGHNHDYTNSENSALHVIHGDNLGKFKTIIEEYMAKNVEQYYKNVDHKLMQSNLFEGGMGVLPYVKTLRKQILPTSTTSCGVDDEGVLSVDMAGNVRTCPHTDISFIGGHIDDLKNVKLKRIDLERYEKHCGSCEVYRLCKSNCPIDVPDDVFYTNCAVEKVYNRAIQNTAFRLIFGNEVVKE
jgi:uncharacterized protein